MFREYRHDPAKIAEALADARDFLEYLADHINVVAFDVKCLVQYLKLKLLLELKILESLLNIFNLASPREVPLRRADAIHLNRFALGLD